MNVKYNSGYVVGFNPRTFQLLLRTEEFSMNTIENIKRSFEWTIPTVTDLKSLSTTMQYVCNFYRNNLTTVYVYGDAADNTNMHCRDLVSCKPVELKNSTRESELLLVSRVCIAHLLKHKDNVFTTPCRLEWE